MKLTETGFQGLYVLEPSVFQDERGFFMESYNAECFKELGIDTVFVQDNHSRSNRNVIRGLHFQNPPFAQTKLIRTLKGIILDVVVDIRKTSATYGKSFSIELTSENKKQLFIPPGFAHGFAALTNDVEILYKCDQFYNKRSEGGLLYNDLSLDIDWQIDDVQAIVSDKDKVNPKLSEFNSMF
ncbi:dTDP-4-dehydrorhamnose 3,5-epimerase [Fulvivirga sp. M361]|uniref:dTDP-4-dehydrorhamnose 3,5-epimerase n=1 Tax=Fulvivirga sp. M361 TaxID=2594266 RepID=UPI00117B7AA9|nr:dTDP-4-dehydrorhamnose 3,5-epimerase [Fulvivirga sp. M361]TRX50966.1 dTDP-4-dehydrorhamnose 3,5-epimerase [Fulvivirga sp. M361]